MKRQPMKREEGFENHLSDEGLISKTYKELLQLNNKKTTQCKNVQRTWVDISPKDIQK